MNDDTKAAWFLDGGFTPTSTLVERLRKPERVVVNEAGFTMLFSSSDKLDAADRIEKLETNFQLQLEWYLSNKRVLDDRIEKLEAALRGIIVHCEVPAPPNAEALKLFARIALEETK